MNRSTIAGALFLLLLFGCGGESARSTDGPEVTRVSSSISTPEGALLSLEDAYRRKDIEAAVRAKDFRIEARLMLDQMNKVPAEQIDDELVAKTAEVLELAYREQFEQEGFPNVDGVESTFPKTEPYAKGIVLVTEVCRHPDGGTSTQRILVAETSEGWRVVNVVQ
ncbi:MAG: hypothetical protein HYR85_09210 [Planctomycetes bacterium]|nr:hypothetical protein [Planctomycetota bacterium]